MKKTILGIVFSLLMTLHIGITAFAAEEVYSASGEDHVIQQGAMGNVYSPADGEDVLRGDYEWEAAFRERLAAAMESYETMVRLTDLEINCERDVFLDIYWDEINRNPQCFYISGYVSWSYDALGNYAYVTLGYRDKYILEDGSLNMTTLVADKKAYESRVKEALSYTDQNMTDLEKLLAVHDFIVRECDYDYGNYLQGTIPQESYSAYGVMINNVAVCNGYALALMDCLNRLGISSYFVSSDEINHAWNMVYLDGYWYHVDATWDDPIHSNNSDYVKEGLLYHNNFVLSDEEITATGHRGWDEDAPKATNNGSYAGYCFRDVNYYYAMNYYDGYWYYLNNSRKLVRSDIACTNVTELTGRTDYNYMHGIGDAMYLANAGGIYKATAPDFTDITAYRIFTNESTYANSTLTEFTIKNRQLVAVLNTNGVDERLVLPIEGLEATPDSYIVSFEGNVGTVVGKTVVVESGKLVTQPADPVRSGYTFKGWYSDADLTKAWDFAKDTVTEDVTLYAKWELIPVAATGVELSSTALTLKIGESFTLKATVLPENATDKTIIWVSSDTKVATVADGKVSAIAVGTTTITVTTASGKTATCTVVVKEQTIKADSVQLDKTSLLLEEGATAILTATVVPENATDKTIIWESTNPEVATVEDGVVTALQEGYTFIKAIASSGVYSSCYVSVKEKVIEVTEVILSESVVTMKEGDVLTLNIILSPEGATNNKISLKNNNGLVVSAELSVLDMTIEVTALKAGTVTLTVITENGTTTTCEITVIADDGFVELGDVTEKWQYDAAKYVFDKGIMTGKGTDANGNAVFAPNDNLTRAEFAQSLYAAAGKPVGENMNNFSDVISGDWYATAVLWAANNGIVSGYGDGRYGVSDYITREQLAAMLYKYAEFKGYDVTARTSLEGFADASTASDWAGEQLQWAVANGVMSGNGESLNPGGTATRAECAAMLRSFLKKFE